MKKRLTRAEKRERTYEELISAAERLFIEQGFHATSVDEIALEAGYTKGAVYSNFDSKEDLFFAVYERRPIRRWPRSSRSCARTDPPRVSSFWPPMRRTGAAARTTAGSQSTSNSGRTWCVAPSCARGSPAFTRGPQNRRLWRSSVSPRSGGS